MTDAAVRTALTTMLDDLDATREARTELYRWFHQHPELSMQEDETSARIEEELKKLGVDEINRVGRTGIVAIVRNGEGPVVAMRADFDALPVKEESGVDFASTKREVNERTGEEVPVMHACGHDMHVMSLLGALDLYLKHRDQWQGTFVGVFQPAEETAEGARDMVDNGVTAAMPQPDVYFSQHVFGFVPLEKLALRKGEMLNGARSIEVTIHGKSTHGSLPEAGIDPIVIAASVVVRLQSIVARELSANDAAVVTVGSIHGGTKSNIIPDDVVLQLNIRGRTDAMLEKLSSSIERIVKAECVAGNAPREPEFRYYDAFPATYNDPDCTTKVWEAFDKFYEPGAMEIPTIAGSEDFSSVPDAFGTPYVFWGIGGFKEAESIPANHSPQFVPETFPTMDRGTEAILVAASPWLMSQG